mmetsp:Transcript_6681/g.17022  ORF Transcript_6681/g.17022 Transcript_6681/m.17022 type:complete len:245 (-) Transcript_6681:1102-1836(-)
MRGPVRRPWRALEPPEAAPWWLRGTSWRQLAPVRRLPLSSGGIWSSGWLRPCRSTVSLGRPLWTAWLLRRAPWQLRGWTTGLRRAALHARGTPGQRPPGTWQGAGPAKAASLQGSASLLASTVRQMAAAVGALPRMWMHAAAPAAEQLASLEVLFVEGKGEDDDLRGRVARLEELVDELAAWQHNADAALATERLTSFALLRECEGEHGDVRGHLAHLLGGAARRIHGQAARQRRAAHPLRGDS